MNHQALYRKYRPKKFDDVCGQSHITTVLKYEAAQGRLSHAYLFCGTRGTGKTSCAKILAKVVNCEAPENGNPCGKCYACTSIDEGSATDVVEMDAASNTGVEYIRDIRDEVTYTPAVLKKRVYIIDEVHMLSIGAFNALLKTLEEPPEHVLFILATTEQHKLPATIVSRCQRFDFRRITLTEITDRLIFIANEEGVTLDRSAAQIIAKQAQGGMRDAINLFELCAGAGHNVTIDRVYESLGISGIESAYSIVSAVKERDYNAIFSSVADVISSSKDISVFWQELISFWRDMIVLKSTGRGDEYLDLTEEDKNIVIKGASHFTMAELIYQSDLLDSAIVSMNRIPQIKRNIAEITLIKMSAPELEMSPEALAARITSIENSLTLLSGFSEPDRRDKRLAIKDEKDSSENAEAVEKTAEVSSESKIQVRTAETHKGGWTEITDKSEMIEKLGSIDPTLKGFVSGANCFVSESGDEILIRVENSFLVSILTKESSQKAIADAFVLSKLSSSDPVVKIEAGNIKQDSESHINEIDNFS